MATLKLFTPEDTPSCDLEVYSDLLRFPMNTVSMIAHSRKEHIQHIATISCYALKSTGLQEKSLHCVAAIHTPRKWEKAHIKKNAFPSGEISGKRAHMDSEQGDTVVVRYTELSQWRKNTKKRS